MDPKTPSAGQIRYGLRAMKTLSLSREPMLSEAELRFMDNVQRAFGTQIDVSELREISPVELANAVRDTRVREQLVWALVAFAVVNGEVDSEEASYLNVFAQALDVQWPPRPREVTP